MTTTELIIVLFVAVFFLAGLALALHGAIGLVRESRGKSEARFSSLSERGDTKQKVTRTDFSRGAAAECSFGR